MSLNCMCVDDEQHALNLLKLYCEKSQDANMVAETTDPWEVQQLLAQHEVDVLFLDIQMPGITGLQLLDLIEPDFAVIMTSAYPEYALDGYKYDVVDYLLKPISYDRFDEAIQRAEHYVDITTRPSIPQSAFLNLRGEVKGSFIRIAINEITYIEALRNHVVVHHTKGKSITLMGISEIESLLKGHCLRIHRSYIVNPKKVNRIERQSVFIDQVNLPIGKTYKAKVYEGLGLP